MTKDEVRNLRTMLQARLDQIERDGVGFSFKVGNASFGETAVTFKLVVVKAGEEGEVNGVGADAFRRNARLFGLQPGDLGKTFYHGAELFKIVGLNTRSHKFPIQAIRSDGKQFKFPASSVVRYLQLAVKE